MVVKPLLAAGVSWLALGVASIQAPRPVDASEIMEIISAHRGKVILVNFWATWCAPCVHEFPMLVEIEKEYRNRGFVIVSVSVDSPGKIDATLLPFLEKFQPGFEVYVKKDGDIITFTRRIDPDWKGTLPATLFFDRGGRPSVKRYSEMRRPEIERILKSLLEEPDL